MRAVLFLFLISFSIFSAETTTPEAKPTHVEAKTRQANQTGCPPEIEQSVRRALDRLKTSSDRALEPDIRRCFTCHHQTGPLTSFREARRKGFDVADKTFEKPIARVTEELQNFMARLTGSDTNPIPGDVATIASASAALDSVGMEKNLVTSAIVQYLLREQRPDGHWEHFVKSRPPTEGSSFTATAQALEALSKYGSGTDVETAVSRARAWLLKPVLPEGEVEPDGVEAKTQAIFGLSRLKSDPETKAAIEKNAAELLAMAGNEKGCWAQKKGMACDAYATSQALRALAVSGLKPGSPIFQAGVQYLLKQQDGSGGWVVSSRTGPSPFPRGNARNTIQALELFITGDAPLTEADLKKIEETRQNPHAEGVDPVKVLIESDEGVGKRAQNQFISMTTTAYATQALLLACQDVAGGDKPPKVSESALNPTPSETGAVINRPKSSCTECHKLNEVSAPFGIEIDNISDWEKSLQIPERREELRSFVGKVLEKLETSQMPPPDAKEYVERFAPNREALIQFLRSVRDANP